jgi:hypothetical protein
LYGPVEKMHGCRQPNFDELFHEARRTYLEKFNEFN